MVIATKKDGKPCLCVDYRSLNKKIKVYIWPLLYMEPIFHEIRANLCFTILDLFWDIVRFGWRSSARKMNMFVCRQRAFQSRVMLFGLPNTPAIFQRMIETILSDSEYVTVYIDVVFIFSYTLKDHVHHIPNVLQIIAVHGLTLNIPKCSVAQPKIAC